MADTNCRACDDLKTNAPNVIVNGLGDAECSSLANDTGLSPSNPNTDCQDLKDLNDCLVGNMAEEVETHDVCEWRPFMKKLIPNIWTVQAAIICAVCGIWTNIHSIWAKIGEILANIQTLFEHVQNLWIAVNNLSDLTGRMDCIIDYVTRGATFSFGEYSQTNTSYIVAGKGVSFLNVSASGTSSDIAITLVSGGLARLSGSCLFYEEDFTDKATVYNYDTSAVNPRYTKSRKGNPNWAGSDTKPGGDGSELVYEIRILKSEFPQINRFFAGLAINSEGGGFHADIKRIPAGRYANGQHGNCDSITGEPQSSSDDRGHLVPEGWEYIQMRITWIEKMKANGTQYTPNGMLGIRLNEDGIPC